MTEQMMWKMNDILNSLTPTTLAQIVADVLVNSDDDDRTMSVFLGLVLKAGHANCGADEFNTMIDEAAKGM